MNITHRNYYLSKVAPVFLAGFIATAMLLSSGFTLLGVLSSTTASAIASPVAEFVELVASVIGGAAAAATLGRDKASASKS